MAKNKQQLINDILDIEENTFTEEELNGLTVKELKELLPEDQADETQAEVPGGLSEYKPKGFLFGQKINSVNKKADPPQLVQTEVDYRIIKFSGGSVKFVKGQFVSNADLQLLNDYQKEYYLEK